MFKREMGRAGERESGRAGKLPGVTPRGGSSRKVGRAFAKTRYGAVGIAGGFWRKQNPRAPSAYRIVNKPRNGKRPMRHSE